MPKYSYICNRVVIFLLKPPKIHIVLYILKDSSAAGQHVFPFLII